MRSTLTRGAAAALLPTLGMLVLAGCGGDSGNASNTPAPSTPAASTPDPSSPSNTADPSGEQADTRIAVTIANGKVNPSGVTIDVRAGDTVQISVTIDAEDEVHVHGYDKEL